MRYDSAMRTLWIGTLLLAISSFAADRDLAGGYSGEWKDMEFRGSYSTATADGQGIDQGTWSAKRKT